MTHPSASPTTRTPAVPTSQVRQPRRRVPRR
jgi:hypothetical protein